MEDAIEREAELAELEDYQTFYPALPSEWTDQLFNQLFSQLKYFIDFRAEEKTLIKKSFELVDDLESLNDPKGVYLKCLDCILY